MKLRFTVRTMLPVVLTLLCAAPALAANGTAEAPFRFYTVLDGLTQSNVVDIEQDHAGYLWFTTARGLNRFDGKDFDQFTIADGLLHNSLTALHVSEDNSVWVGDARGGFTAVHGARVVHTIEAPSDMVSPVLDIEFVEGRKFAVVEDIGIVEIAADEGEFVVRILIDDETRGIQNLLVHETDIWVESATGLYRFDLAGDPQLTLLSDTIRRAHTDPEGTLWVVHANGSVGIWRNNTFYETAIVDTENEIVGISKDRDELVWVATSRELFNIAASTSSSDVAVRKFTGADDITSLFIDRENSLWLSSGSRLIRFLGDRFQHFRLRTEFDSETVWTISEDEHGRFWFGTESKLLLRQHDETLIVVGEDFGMPDGTVRDIVADDEGNLWIGVSENGLYRFDVDAMKATHVTTSGKVNVLDVALGHDGAVWYTTIGSGVYQYI